MQSLFFRAVSSALGRSCRLECCLAHGPWSALMPAGRSTVVQSSSDLPEDMLRTVDIHRRQHHLASQCLAGCHVLADVCEALQTLFRLGCLADKSAWWIQLECSQGLQAGSRASVAVCSLASKASSAKVSLGAHLCFHLLLANSPEGTHTLRTCAPPGLIMCCSLLHEGNASSCLTVIQDLHDLLRLFYLAWPLSLWP